MAPCAQLLRTGGSRPLPFAALPKILGGLLLLVAAALSAAVPRILLVARDLEDRPLAGIRFAYGGVESLPTNRAGATELELPPAHGAGQMIKVHLLPEPKRADDWFLVNPQINVPSGSGSAEVVLMRRSAFRRLAADARDATEKTARPAEPTTEDRKRALAEAAARHGLTAGQLETALRSFAETQDPKDRGIALFLEGQYSRAEELLDRVIEKKEADLVETLRYLGAAQFEQAKYRAAEGSFRKALVLRGEDAFLLSWLGGTLLKLAAWAEAEPLLRRSLALGEQSLGPDHPEVATRLGNLAHLLHATNRLAEAEPPLRRALAIDEKSFGPDHPEVATDLNNLASLLKDMNRLPEAEPMMRRALAIDEASFGPDHPNVSRDLNNLAQQLEVTNRLAEAESLLRRALAIDEKSLGPDHPEVAIRLNNLAMLLQLGHRLAAAEPLMRRALAIDEQRFGPDHPNVATDLNNLATLLRATNRFAEAEPLMRRSLAVAEESFGPDHPNVAVALDNLGQLLHATGRFAEAEPLMRRALAIDERSFGPDHPTVATDLNNLALLLQATNRLAEAEPPMRRMLAIFLEFERRTGHEHPNQAQAAKNYRELLRAMGKSPAEIEAATEALALPPR